MAALVVSVAVWLVLAVLLATSANRAAPDVLSAGGIGLADTAPIAVGFPERVGAPTVSWNGLSDATADERQRTAPASADNAPSNDNAPETEPRGEDTPKELQELSRLAEEPNIPAPDKER